MSVKVVTLQDDWRHIRLRLPLNRFNRNPGGGMFGGSIAALADPVAALACNRVFPGHQVWTRFMRLDFRREGRTDLELRFDFDPDLEQAIGSELEWRGRANPTFEYDVYDEQDRLCVRVTNTVAIRPGDYRPGERTEVS
jgi:acyl-coenzyme A thioesterase PaaI-like protein